MCITEHIYGGRQDRIAFIKSTIGFGNEIESVYWDKGHRDGAEIHRITDTGIIIVENANSHRIVTCLIATPRQIRRYYSMLKKEAPKSLLKIAREHENEGWNYK